VGYKRAMEMFITNRVLDAQQALEWGLINQIVEDAQLADTAAALAARLAAGPAGAYGLVKRLLAEAEPGWEAQLAREGQCIAGRAETAEGKEGIAAFLEKRTPKFT
jgi:2-(1,2-epoxy-1,2-dihydrophenyl)acetyl-CoA isomerase